MLTISLLVLGGLVLCLGLAYALFHLFWDRIPAPDLDKILGR